MPSHNPPWRKPISFLPDLNPTGADLGYPLAKTPLSSSYKEYRNFADIFPQDLT
jgi:hypothetical protein